MDRKLRRPVPTLALLGAALVAFLLLQAIEFVVPVGNSMEPLVGRNDLVIFRDAPEYRIGDVVAYEHPEIGIVLHRIIDVDEADRFVLQGDNNDFIDGHHPTPDEVRGMMWMRIPLIGPFLRWIPVLFLALAFLLRFALPGGSDDESSDRRRRLPAMTDGPLPGGVSLRVASMTVALTAGVVLLALLTLPATRKGGRDATFMHSIDLAYSAPGPSSVYPAGEVTTGDPVFTRLIDHLDLEMTYRVASELVVRVTEASAALTVEMTTPDGLTYQFPVTEGAIERGEPLRGTLQFSRLQEVISTAQSVTGVSYSNFDVDIVASVSLDDATIEGQAVGGAPEVVFPMRFDGQVLRSVSDRSGNAPAATLMEPQTVTLPDNRPASIPLLVANVSLHTLETLVAAIFIISGIVAFATRNGDAPRRRESDLDRMVRGAKGMILPVDTIDASKDSSTISVKTFQDIVDVAQAAGEFILHRRGEHHHVFAVLHDSVRYVYIWSRVTAPDDLADLDPAVMDAAFTVHDGDS